jgi:hypothetical protein
VAPHPYRELDAVPNGAEANERAAAFEERCLAVVLLVAGAIGLLIGISAPRANATELVLGAMFGCLGLWTLRPRRPRG